MKRLLLAALAVLIWAGVAGATVPKYWIVTTATLGSDSSDAAPDAVFLFWLDQASATLDSAAMTPLNTDSLVWVYLLDANLEGWVKTYNPVAFAKWYFGSAIIRDNALGTIPWSTGHLDSLDQVIAASVDTSDMEYIAGLVDDTLTANHGAAAWTSSSTGAGGTADSVFIYNYLDSTPVGAGVNVWLYPNNGGTPLNGQTDANGLVQFSVSVDTFLVYTSAAGWSQTTVPDSNFVIAAYDTTFYMTPRTYGAPTSPALTMVSFRFYDVNGLPINLVPVKYKLEGRRGSEFHHLDSTKNIVGGREGSAISDTTGLASIEVISNDSIIVYPNEIGTTRYRITATDPRTGLPLFGKDGIVLKVPASATALLYPQDF